MFRALSLEPLSIVEVERVAHERIELDRDGHNWVVRTLDTPITVHRRLTQTLAVEKQSQLTLLDDDVIWVNQQGFHFRTDPWAQDELLERRAVDRWNDSDAFAVLADRMLEAGDPLGQDIVESLGLKRSTPIGPHPWIGTAWRHGLLQRVALGRPDWAGAVSWREALLEIMCSRRARFLEEVAIDLHRHVRAGAISDVAAQLVTLPWPRWLTRLHLGDANEAVLLPISIGVRCPRFDVAPLFRSTERARLVLESIADTMTVEGLETGCVTLHQGLRMRVFPRKVLFERPTWPRFDSWPSWDFSFQSGRWFLSWRHGAPKSDDVKLNGMDFFHTALLAGDRIEVAERVVLRFEALPER